LFTGRDRQVVVDLGTEHTAAVGQRSVRVGFAVDIAVAVAAVDIEGLAVVGLAGEPVSDRVVVERQLAEMAEPVAAQSRLVAVPLPADTGLARTVVEVLLRRLVLVASTKEAAV
jgi:Na+/glutamate symporter